MPEPSAYLPDYDFTASESGPQLNTEFANIAASISDVIEALADVRRSDGSLQNQVVTADTLATSALVALGPNGSLISAAVDLAEASATSAAASAATATTQASAAAASAGTATTQAGSAATSASTATAQAGSAAVQAGLAAASASAASVSAGAAAASASAAAASVLEVATGATTVAFSAHLNGADQTGIVSATPTKVAAATEVFDQGGFYDVAQARWTPPAGRYRLTGVALFSAAVVDQQQYRAMIYKNGALWRQVVETASGTSAVSAAVSAIDAASGTDYYEFFVQGDGAGNKTVSGSSANTWFEGSAL